MIVEINTGTKSRNILARERESRAMELRTKGWTYRAIAAELGVTDVAVMKMVRKLLGRTMTLTHEKTEEVRSLELGRLDDLIKAHWEWAMKGDEKSSAIILRCMDRRAAYLGLDAPKKVEVKEVSDIDRQLDDLVQRIKSRSQVPPTVEIECEAEPVDSGGRMEQLALPSGSRVGEDSDGGGGCSPFRSDASGQPDRPNSADIP